MTGFIPAPIKPEITVDHLEKIDVRVGVVERVELVPTSAKLVKLTVDFGDRRRTVLAGLRRERVTLKRKSKAVRRCLWLISQRVGWQVRFPRRCCSTSAIGWPYTGARDTGKAATKRCESGMNGAFDQAQLGSQALSRRFNRRRKARENSAKWERQPAGRNNHA